MLAIRELTILVVIGGAVILAAVLYAAYRVARNTGDKVT